MVREKFHTVRVCSVMEAADEMENLGHAFYAFRYLLDARIQGYCVLYRV